MTQSTLHPIAGDCVSDGLAHHETDLRLRLADRGSRAFRLVVQVQHHRARADAPTVTGR
jgi:hypothetical protein